MSKKFLILLVLLFSILLIIPSSFAEDADNNINYENINQLNENDLQDISIDNEENVLNVGNEENLNNENDQVGESSENADSQDEIAINEIGEKNSLKASALGASTYKITVNNVKGQEGQSVKVTAKITLNNKAVSTGYVIFDYPNPNDEDKYLSKEVKVSNGVASFTFNLPKFKKSTTSEINYETYATYYNNNWDELCDTIYKINVTKASSSSPSSSSTPSSSPSSSNPKIKTYLYAFSAKSYVGKKVTLEAYIYDADELYDISGGYVTFKFRGKSYKVKVSHNFAKKTIAAPSKYGTFTYSATYGGSSKFTSSSGKNKVTNNLRIKIKSPSITVKKGSKKKFAVKITNYYTKKGIKGFKVKIRVKVSYNKWKTYTVKTNKKGIAYLSTKRFKPGYHDVIVTSGNKDFKFKTTANIDINCRKCNAPCSHYCGYCKKHGWQSLSHGDSGNIRSHKCCKCNSNKYVKISSIRWDSFWD